MRAGLSTRVPIPQRGLLAIRGTAEYAPAMLMLLPSVATRQCSRTSPSGGRRRPQAASSGASRSRPLCCPDTACDMQQATCNDIRTCTMQHQTWLHSGRFAILKNFWSARAVKTSYLTQNKWHSMVTQRVLRRGVENTKTNEKWMARNERTIGKVHNRQGDSHRRPI